MIAIPVKSEEENSNLLEEFGKAEYFALINNGYKPTNGFFSLCDLKIA